MPEQRRRPAQRPRIDDGKTQHAVSAALLVDRVHTSRKLFVALSSLNFFRLELFCCIFLLCIVAAFVDVMFFDAYYPQNGKKVNDV